MNALAPYYPWLKALHILAVIAWMAGLLYLPRLFVYHAAAPVGSPQSEVFKVMERRLQRGIMNPAMAATWIFGILLALTPGILSWSSWWIYLKLACVVGLTIAHEAFASWRKAFAADANRRPPRFYRMVNEVPTLLLVAIVFLVVLKPF